jgi:hypothetical protein
MATLQEGRVPANVSLAEGHLRGVVCLAGRCAPAAKLFAAFYALFSGLEFVAVAGVVLTPWIHRLLHWVHLDEKGLR